MVPLCSWTTSVSSAAVSRNTMRVSVEGELGEKNHSHGPAVLSDMGAWYKNIKAIHLEDHFKPSK